MKIKKAKVVYEEDGKFNGNGSDIDKADISCGDYCYVLSVNEWNKLEKTIKSLVDDASGDIDFIKYSINKLFSNE